MHTIDYIWQLIEENVAPKIIILPHRKEYEYVVDNMRFTKVIHTTGEVTRKQHVYQRQGKYQYATTDNNFIKLYTHIKTLLRSGELSRPDHSIFMDIATYISWESQFVEVNGLRANISILAEELGLDKANLRKALHRLEKLGLLEIVEQGRQKYVSINKAYVSKGRFLPTDELVQ
jgi:DNA-binding MarR family transcriptional regulator